jgi:signal transduction histidine kinase
LFYNEFMERLRRPYIQYLLSISALGALILLWGIVQFPTYSAKLNLILLIALAGLSATATVSVPVSAEIGVTYAIGPAVGLAAIPFFGPGAAALIVAVFNLSAWLVKPQDNITWKKSWAQLAFNIGMHCVAISAASVLLLLLRRWLGAESMWGQLIPWLPAAYLFEELNFWLLAGILRLQHGERINAVAMWKEDYWATQIGVLVAAVGGGVLAFAIQHYDWVGIVIFYLPILLSAYAFRLYTWQMQANLANLEQIVAERTKDLAALNHQKDAYLAVLSHDMMAPLTTIQLCAEELQEDPQAAAENPLLITFMLRGQRTLVGMVHNILDIEKLQAGGTLVAQKSDCDLEQLLSNVFELMQLEAIDKRITLQKNVTAQPAVIYADCQQMERILLNLVSNAVKYTQAGGSVWADIYPELPTTTNQMVIAVKDSGYGIPAAELPFIFDRFRRVDRHKDKAHGTGLGLAITKALIEEHGGTISVSSQEGKGSNFIVKLPIQRR